MSVKHLAVKANAMYFIRLSKATKYFYTGNINYASLEASHDNNVLEEETHSAFV